MHFKNGVYLDIQPEMAKGLPLIDAAYDDLGLDAECVVTSANDGRHMDGSLHYLGRAVDLRTRDLHEDVIRKLANALRMRLNGSSIINRPYQVVVEKDHIHVEWQPKPGE
jgi:hypothetical protein